ncbi:ATP-binding protein [Desulfovibrio intestinalis]|uniref:histidine kinase n=1 Tax=Desulfovibrio intestinalis TaxID=58621 RepID=A0A7W8C2W6_9BACT|nr:ATP-binding protein [Desulfovibrio intestinalis]MBB5143219.1 two-component system phosphate regulon sensor histidine kinase PhoR [Desulfovibrio intestinalis]
MFSFRTRIFCGMLAVALVSIAVAVFYGKAWFEKVQLDAARERLVRETVLAGAILDGLGDHTSGLPQLAAILNMPEERLSLLNSKGSVLGDTAPGAQPITRLDNHADRPEVREAMNGTPGFAIRPSGTLGKDLAYAAVALRNGDILRVSVPLASLRQIIDSRLAVFTQIGLITVALSLVLAGLLSGALRRSLSQMVSVVEAISLGNFQRRLRRIPGREFAPLADAVNRMAENIEEHIRAAAEQTAQLESILDTMSDGVLVLGPRGRIRRCNRALAREFPAAASALGAQVVEVIPSPPLQNAVDDIMAEAEAQNFARQRALALAASVAHDAAENAGSVKSQADFSSDATSHEQTSGLDDSAKADLVSGAAASAAGGTENGDIVSPESGRVQRYLHLELPSGQVMSVCISLPGAADAAEGGQVGAVAVFHDITELMRLERVRRDFVANVSHELRTPLTAIQGYAETLISLDGPPECRRFGEIILKHGVCLSRMVDDLLTLARLEGKSGSLELAPVDPREALAQATGMCREVLERRHCRVESHIAPDCRVMASLPHLTQVFRNLLENAGRYAPEGGSIRVNARQVGDSVVFRVTDDGPGIPRQDLERVFERFYQVERHRGQASTGLGLAICKHIIERHGGSIRAESPAPDGNTALVFTLTSVHGAAQS